MKLIENLIISFEALATGKTLDDVYLLLADLGFKDKLILVGCKGITTLGAVCTDPQWAKQRCEEVLVRFRGGPDPDNAVKKTYTASVRSLLVDRLIRSVEVSGLDMTLEAIRTIWGINVVNGSSIEATDGTPVAALTS